jgi:hypothetical protein
MSESRVKYVEVNLLKILFPLVFAALMAGCGPSLPKKMDFQRVPYYRTYEQCLPYANHLAGQLKAAGIKDVFRVDYLWNGIGGNLCAHAVVIFNDASGKSWIMDNQRQAPYRVWGDTLLKKIRSFERAATAIQDVWTPDGRGKLVVSHQFTGIPPISIDEVGRATLDFIK